MFWFIIYVQRTKIYPKNNNIVYYKNERIDIMSTIDIKSLDKNASIHFVGIGGISMSGIAEIMLKRGFKVSGSDRSKTHITDRLEKLGAVVYEGQRAENVNGASLVVYTAAVKSDNPELTAAKEASVPTMNRAEFLGSLMKEYPEAIGIAGTHGKTTTTSILTHALLKAGTDATVSIGGELDLIGGNVRAGNSSYFLTEACEYTNSFLSFFPKIAVITNIEEDHLDFFKNIEEIRESFLKFALLTKGKGAVIACGDDENIKLALEGHGLNLHYYGLSEDAEYTAANIVYSDGLPSFDVLKNGIVITHIDLSVPGEHNIKNALASIAVCVELGLDLDVCAEGISEFYGTKRRFERKGTLNGAVLMDDYAHHPTEIKATIEAAKRLKKSKIRVVFQPHTYSRTRTLWNDFVKCFDGVDELILADIYPAREVFDGVTKSENLANDIKEHGTNVIYIDSFDKIISYLNATASENELIFTMGAGDVVKIAEVLATK